MLYWDAGTFMYYYEIYIIYCLNPDKDEHMFFVGHLQIADGLALKRCKAISIPKIDYRCLIIFFNITWYWKL